MQRFIPLRDHELYAPRAPLDRLVPYRVGLPCLHWQAVIEEPGGEQRVVSMLTDPDAADPRDEAGAPARLRR